MKGVQPPHKLITIMALSVIGVLMLTIWLLYEVSLEQQSMRLTEIVKSNARMIEAIAEHETHDPGHAHDDTLEQVRNAHRTFKGFGESGEFSLAILQGDHIEFLLSHRHNELLTPQPIPFNSHLAVPMRRALLKESGVIIGSDYRGEMVLAAHEVIDHMGWGIVAKIDMEEIRAPFIQAALISTIIATLLIAMGSMAIIKLVVPLLHKVRDERDYRLTLFESSPIGLALCHMDGSMVDANPAYEKIIGRTLNELKSLSYWDITPTKYAEEEAEQLHHLKQDGYYGPYEKEYIHKDGYLVPVRLSGRVVNRGGKRFIWSSVEDISDKICTERRLQQAATIFETTDEGIVITDENNRIIMVNSAYTEITGYSEAEALGQNPRLLRSGKHDAAFYEKLWRQLDTKDSWRGEMWNRRKDGSLFPVWQQISVIRGEDGRVTNYTSIFSDISELKAIEQQLAHLAHHDELTGLPNRLYFRAQVDQSLQQARRHGHHMALLFLDLDGFKQINDSFGHDVGDLLLKEIAKRLSDSLREEDMVARMGGDEFIIILNQINHQDDAALVAANIVTALARPVELTHHTLTPFCSIGIGIYPDDGESVIGLQKAADHAMYQAKEAGKNTYKFFGQQV